MAKDMQLRSWNPLAANRSMTSTAGGLLARSTGDSHAATIVLSLLIATLWLTTRPYVGVIQDSRFYTVQALNALLPGRFANDLYFYHGSQDQFTAFSLIYKPVLAALGIAKAAMLLTVVGQCCWIAGLVYLARGMFRDGRLALIAVALAVVLPGGIFFDYGEQFLTPRLFAECLTLFALGLMLRGRPVWALAVLGVSATVHPLMTLPGFAILFLHEGASRRAWWLAGLLAVAVSLGLALLGIQPFVRALETFDPAWFSIVRVRDFFCLITEWNTLAVLKASNMLALCTLVLCVARPHERPFFLAVTAVAVGGLAANLIGGDMLRNVLVVDVQQYRATWPLALVTNLFVGALLLRLWESFSDSLTRSVVVISLATLLMAKFVAPDYYLAAPMMVVAALAGIWDRYWRRPVPARLFVRVILAIVCGLVLTCTYSYVDWIRNDLPEHRQAVRGVGLTAAVLAAFAMYALAWAHGHWTMNRLLVGFAGGLTLIAATGWDQRTPWTIFVEGEEEAPSGLSALLPADKSIYWEGDVRVPWFVLRRSSYFSCAQGTGALFFRGIAMDYQHRFDSFERLQTLDFGQESTCPAFPKPKTRPNTRDDLASVCVNEPGLGALVLTRPVNNADGRMWVSPAEYEDARPGGGQWQVSSTHRFFVYSCADFL